MVKRFDEILFQLINSKWTNPFLDLFFPFWTDFQKTYFFKFLIFPFLLFLIYRKFKWTGIVIVLIALLISGIFDIFIDAFKGLFERPRPAAAKLPFNVVLRGSVPGGFSFPSGHASDAFFLAAYLSSFFSNLKLTFYVLAILTAYSRIYCGIHFPFDALGGAFLGTIFGYGSAVIVKRVIELGTRKRGFFWRT